MPCSACLFQSDIRRGGNPSSPGPGCAHSALAKATLKLRSHRDLYRLHGFRKPFCTDVGDSRRANYTETCPEVDTPFDASATHPKIMDW